VTAATAAAVALGCCAFAASAQTIYSSNGWEAAGTPAWTTGTISGQNSWGTLDGSTPTGHNSTTYGKDAFQIVTSPNITGPGGSETVTPYDGSQMLASATTYEVADSSTVSYYNLAHDSFYTAWGKRTAGNNVMQTQVEYFMPQVDSTLLGENGFEIFSGAFGLTSLGEVGLSNDTSGNVDLTWVPASATYGSTIVVTSAQYPVLQRDAWTPMTIFMDYNTGSVSISVNNQIILNTGPKSFETTNSYYCSEFGNISNIADSTNDYIFWDDYNIVASTPGPGALPIFSAGFAALAFGARRRRRRA
jgi:hypothetical protein